MNINAQLKWGSIKLQLTQFIDLFIKVIGENKLSAPRIYNTDESGIVVVSKQHSRVIDRKEQHQVGVLKLYMQKNFYNNPKKRYTPFCLIQAAEWG